jgi:hypothetical protein
MVRLLFQGSYPITESKFFNRVVQKPQFPGNFPIKIPQLAAMCGKFRETCERTGKFLNKSNVLSIIKIPVRGQNIFL